MYIELTSAILSLMHFYIVYYKHLSNLEILTREKEGKRKPFLSKNRCRKYIVFLGPTHCICYYLVNVFPFYSFLQRSRWRFPIYS